MEQRAITDEDKSLLVGQIKRLNMTDLVATHRRLHQMAAQGNTLTGFSREDMEWFHARVEEELRRRAEEDGRDPPEPSPLEWGRSADEGEELVEVDPGDDRHFPSQVGAIAEKAKKKAKEKKTARRLERRLVTLDELRVADADEGPRIIGHAAVFHELSEDLFGFRERIQPGAFRKTIREGDVRALWNHDPNFILGRTKSGTLRLAEDERGLAVEIDPPETQWARDLLVSIKRGDVDQMSFGFKAVKDRWSTQDGVNIRDLLEVRLFDVSPVVFPAYPQTDVAVRQLWWQFYGPVPTEPGQAPHSAEPTQREPRQAPHSLAMLRRRLDLKARHLAPPPSRV